MANSIQSLLNAFFPGNTGTTNQYGQSYGGVTEQGIDISLPAGSPIRLPVAASYSAANSTAYQSVFVTPAGQAVSFTHINGKAFADGAKVAAGAIIGDVTALTGVYSSRGVTYHSSGPHVEFGVYASPQAAYGWQQTYTRDPLSWLMGVKDYGKAPSAPTPQQNIVTDPAGTVGAVAGRGAGDLGNALNPLHDVPHLLLLALLAVALIGVLLILLAQLGHKTGLVSPAMLAAA